MLTVFSALLILAILVVCHEYIIMILICTYLLTNEVDQFLLYLESLRNLMCSTHSRPRLFPNSLVGNLIYARGLKIKRQVSNTILVKYNIATKQDLKIA